MWQSWCQYKFYEEMEYTRSSTQPGRNPVFNHDKLYRFPKEDVSHRVSLRTLQLSLHCHVTTCFLVLCYKTYLLDAVI